MQIRAFFKINFMFAKEFFFYFHTEQVSITPMCMRINEAFVQKLLLQFSVYIPYPKTHDALSQTAFL